jgi:hypothetical protein
MTSELSALWNQPINAGPYKRSDAVITREFIALQTPMHPRDILSAAPNWFGVPAGVFATLRRPKNGTGKLGKNGWTAELLVESANGDLALLSGIGAGDINNLPKLGIVKCRIVNVRPADASDLIATYQSSGFVRGSQQLPDADRNPVTGTILKPDVVTEPETKPEPVANVETESTPIVETKPEPVAKSKRKRK